MSLGSGPPQLYSLASRVPSGGGSGGLGSCQSCSHEPSASQLLQSDSWDLWPGLLAYRREGDSAREGEGGAGASPPPIHTLCPTSSPAQAGWLGSQSSSHRAEPTQIRPPAAGWGGKHDHRALLLHPKGQGSPPVSAQLWAPPFLLLSSISFSPQPCVPSIN